MQVYIFSSASIENIQRGIEKNCWAVASMDGPHESARRTRANDMDICSAALFYCSGPQMFTTPFIVETKAEDRAISDIWEDTWYLPFKIRAIGELTHKIPWQHARNSWRFLRDDENPGGLVTPARVFAPVQVFRQEWDMILTQLGVDPEAYEELW